MLGSALVAATHCVPSRLVALHRLRLIQPFLKASMRIAAPPHGVRRVVSQHGSGMSGVGGEADMPRTSRKRRS